MVCHIFINIPSVTGIATKIAYYKFYSESNLFLPHLAIKHTPSYEYKLIVHACLINCHYGSEICVQKSCLLSTIWLVLLFQYNYIIVRKGNFGQMQQVGADRSKVRRSYFIWQHRLTRIVCIRPKGRTQCIFPRSQHSCLYVYIYWYQV